MEMKKINCKDGLNYKEEIQARKMRRKLEENDEELIQKVMELYAKWYKKPNKSFLSWLKDKDEKVLSSALSRLDNWQEHLL